MSSVNDENDIESEDSERSDLYSTVLDSSAPDSNAPDSTPDSNGEPAWTYPQFSLLRLLLITLNIASVLAAVRLGLNGTVPWEIAVSLAYAGAVVPWYVWHGITEEWSLAGLLVIALIAAFMIALCMPAIF